MPIILINDGLGGQKLKKTIITSIIPCVFVAFLPQKGIKWRIFVKFQYKYVWDEPFGSNISFSYEIGALFINLHPFC